MTAPQRRRSCPFAPGIVFDVLRAAGIDVPPGGAKRTICCPLHRDARASAFASERNVFYCSVCTPERGWSARLLAARLRVPWPLTIAASRVDPRARQSASEPARRDPEFPAEVARRVWRDASAGGERSRADDDSAVHAYVARRGLCAARDLGLYRVLADGAALPAELSRWRRGGYLLLAALHDVRDGTVVNVQARTVLDAAPKVIVPRGSRVAGTVFATAPGLDLLRGAARADHRVVLGEGLTDFLALGAATRVAVLACPGTSTAARALGRWVRGRTLVLALDLDAAGDEAVGRCTDVAYGLGASRVRRLRWPANCNDACDVVQRLGFDAFALWIEAQLNG